MDIGIRGILSCVLCVLLLFSFLLEDSLAQAPDLKVRARILTTKGTIVLKMHHAQAPKAVTSFVRLARTSQFDDISFFRIIPGVLVQVGSSAVTASAPADLGDTEFRHLPGVVSFLSRREGENLSAFVIMLGQADWLNGKQEIFAEVIEGHGVLRSLELLDRIKTIKIEHEGSLERAE